MTLFHHHHLGIQKKKPSDYFHRVRIITSSPGLCKNPKRKYKNIFDRCLPVYSYDPRYEGSLVNGQGMKKHHGKILFI